MKQAFLEAHVTWDELYYLIQGEYRGADWCDYLPAKNTMRPIFNEQDFKLLEGKTNTMLVPHKALPDEFSRSRVRVVDIEVQPGLRFPVGASSRAR
jgi:hypothetical protein